MATTWRMAFSGLHCLKHSIKAPSSPFIRCIATSQRLCSASATEYENIIVETVGEKNDVGLISLHRPKALNALCEGLFADLTHALKEFRQNASIGAVVLTGKGKAFAAGTIPGAGGTQRLPRAVGKSKAMEMCLTGDQISADEALQFGLVSKVLPGEQLVEEAIKTASKIASNSKLITMICKEMINRGYNVSLDEGIHYERRMFQSTFQTHDRREGMAAFLEKRKPVFQDK